jgi:predicted aspartyl protease
MSGSARRVVPAMGTIWNSRSLLFIVALICWLTSYPVEGRAAEEKSDGRAAVLDESLPVHSGMSAHSPVVNVLKRGDVVTIEYEMEGSLGAWCGIIEEGRAAISGYVPCGQLRREEPMRKSWERVGATGGTGGDTTSVIVRGNQVLVPVVLGCGGRTVEALLLLDTGASISMINTEIADKLGIKPAETKMGVGQVVGGGLIVLFIAKIDYLTAGPFTKSGMEISVVIHKGSAVNYDGLLGMDFLRDLKYTVDTRDNLIRWEGSP